MNKLLAFNDRVVFSGDRAISKMQMGHKVSEIFAQFDARKKQIEAQQADKEELDELRKIEKELAKR